MLKKKQLHHKQSVAVQKRCFMNALISIPTQYKASFSAMSLS